MDSIIRPWQMEDAPRLARIIDNSNILSNLRDGIPHPYTKADAEDYIRAMQRQGDAVYAFAVLADRQVAGSISVTRQANIHRRTAELGYYIAQSHWGQGLATRAVGEACRYIFSQTDIIRIFAEPFAYNTASCRVLEKNGFVCEGVLRKNAVKTGRVLNMRMYALIKE